MLFMYIRISFYLKHFFLSASIAVRSSYVPCQNLPCLLISFTLDEILKHKPPTGTQATDSPLPLYKESHSVRLDMI